MYVKAENMYKRQKMQQALALFSMIIQHLDLIA